MFRRKKAQEAAPQQQAQSSAPPMTSSNGYQVTEVPTYHKGKRRIVVYRSDPSGRIIKTFKK
jgi:hypothetical protein